MMCPQSTSALLPEVVHGAVYPERVLPTLPWLDACAQRAVGPIARRWRSRLWAGHEFVERVSGLAITYECLKETEFQPAAETLRAALLKQGLTRWPQPQSPKKISVSSWVSCLVVHVPAV